MRDNNDAILSPYYQTLNNDTNSFDLGSKPLATISRRFFPLSICRGCFSCVFVNNSGLSLGFLSIKRGNFEHASIACFKHQRTSLITPTLNMAIVWEVIEEKQQFWALFSPPKGVTYNKTGSNFQ